MANRKILIQILIAIGVAGLALAIAIPAIRRIPGAYAAPIFIGGMLFGMAVTRAELALRRRRPTT